MGKNKKKINKSGNHKTFNNSLPKVSVCTPTFNRRPFISTLIKCFDHQTYPKNLLEWIIIDDGTDPIEDLVKNHPQVKYFKYDTKMTLGKKRNLMHEKTTGSIIVYMDDDDYYPPTRVSHAVEMLNKNPDALCAGASEIYIYFKHIQKLYQFGPYGPNHATAGTFAFKRKLIHTQKYNEKASLAEEKEFLNDYKIPFVQLDPKHVILVFSHIHNTFDKKKLLEGNINNKYIQESDKSIDYFINESDIKQFFMNEIEEALEKYEPGKPEMKPDVLLQMKEIEIKRKKMLEEQQQKQNKSITLKQGDNPPVQLTQDQAIRMMQLQQEKIKTLINENTTLKNIIKNIIKENPDIKYQIESQLKSN